MKRALVGRRHGVARNLLGLGLPIGWLGFAWGVAYEDFVQDEPEKPVAKPKAEPAKPAPKPKPKPKPRTEERVDTRAVAEPEMVSIPGGCFEMGSPEAELDYPTNERQHRVCVRDFMIGKYEVTQGEWKSVMGNNPSYFKNCGDRCPVEWVSWNDVQDYIEKLNAKTGKKYRLPTEAEWEYAARAGTKTPFWTGDCISTDQANYNAMVGPYRYKECEGKTRVNRMKTLPVGSFAANPWGLYDTIGNVWEWTCSAYDEKYQGGETRCAINYKAYSSPRAARGGSWNTFFNEWLRSAHRQEGPPGNFNINRGEVGEEWGFRLAQGEVD